MKPTNRFTRKAYFFKGDIKIAGNLKIVLDLPLIIQGNLNVKGDLYIRSKLTVWGGGRPERGGRTDNDI
jgi:hypothetical protein